ncbi:MAG: hypothetical protein BKP49_01585 [Treponema sp. CETP13]|nr:MAG: hypothetical protein BKP49_01585 [Treponema sp. CETP13]
MKYNKIINLFLITFFAISITFAQNTVAEDNEKSEVTVEQEYLRTVEDVVIRELANSDNFDTKLVALQHIEDALSEGHSSPEIESALQDLAGEGILKETRKANRLTNNYPQIRSKACEMLGEIKTQNAEETLLKIVNAETEPMVLSSAVRSLGKIGINKNNEVTNAIAWVEHRYSIVNPTDSLAYEVLDTYEMLFDTIKTKEGQEAVINSIAQISANYRYVTPIRTKARDLLKTLSLTEE